MLKMFLSAVLPETILVFLALAFVLIAAYWRKIRFYAPVFFVIASIFAIYGTFYYCAESNTELVSKILIASTFTFVMKVLLLLAFIAVLINLRQDYNRASEPHYEVPVLMTFSVVGGLILISSNDLLVLYLGLELMSLPLYVLTAFNFNGLCLRSNEAGIKFFILGALSSCIYLFGASILYGFSSSTGFEDIGKYYISVVSNDGIEAAVPIAVLIALVLVMASMFFKMSAAPFHMWTPDVYQGASTIVTMFLSTIPKIAVVSMIINILYVPFIDLIEQWQQIVVFVAVISLLIGSLGGLMQKDIKRMLAYGTIGHVGFILVGLGIGELSGLFGALLYIALYVGMNLLIFSIIIHFEQSSGYKGKLYQLGGLAKRSGWLAFAILVAMLSMAGIPPFSGFFAKFYILLSAMENGFYPLAVLAVVVAVVSCFYYLRVVKIMYFDKVSEEFEIQRMPTSIQVSIAFGVLINLAYIVLSSPLINIIQKAAEAIIPNE